MRAQNNSIQAFWVMISGFSSFALGLLSAVIFSRYFEKAEYGTYRQIIYVYNTLLIIFSAGLPSVYSYFLPKLDQSQGKHIIDKLTILFLVLGFGFSLFLFVSSDIIARILNNPDLGRGLKLFSPVPLLMMPTLGVEGIYTAVRKTHVLAIYTTVTRLGMLAFITLPVVLFSGSYETAILGWVLSSSLTLIIAIYIKYKPFKDTVKSLSSSVTYKTILNYSIPLMVASLAGTFILAADQFFISRFFGKEVFADFSNGFIPLPFVTMITGSVHAIFVPLFANLIEKENGYLLIAKKWNNGVTKAIVILFPILIFFMFFANEVVLVLYGPLYEKSTIYFRLSLLTNFSTPLLYYSILLAAGKTKIYARLQIITALAIWIFGFFVCNLGGSAVLYVLISVILGLISRSVGLHMAIKTIEASFLEILDLKHIGVIVIISIATCLIIKQSLLILTDSVLLSLIIGGGIYFGLIIIGDKWLRFGIFDTIKSLLGKN